MSRDLCVWKRCGVAEGRRDAGRRDKAEGIGATGCQAARIEHGSGLGGFTGRLRRKRWDALHRRAVQEPPAPASLTKKKSQPVKAGV